MSAGGTPLPTEGRLSGRVDHEPSEARPAAARSALLLRSLRQTSRLEPFRPHRRTSRTLAWAKYLGGVTEVMARADANGTASAGWVALTQRIRSREHTSEVQSR